MITDTLSDMPLLLTARQVAGVIGVSPTTVYRLVDAGDLKKVEVSFSGDSKTIRITNESVHDLIERWMNNTD